MSSSAEPIAPSGPPESSMDTSVPAQAQAAAEAAPVTAEPAAPNADSAPSHLQAPTPMSKNALKRQRKQQAWEAGRDDRRLKRREKRLAHKQRVRTERAALVAGGADPRVVYRRDKHVATLVPMSIVLDCDFEQYMTDKERVSLSSQITRAYSDNRNAQFRAHLWVAGFGGKLAQRFNEVLQAQQLHWKGASVFAGDFVACAAGALEQMTSFKTVTPTSEEEEQKQAGHQPADEQLMIGALRRSLESPVPWPRDAHDPFPLPNDPEPPLDPEFKDVVYLSSDSPYTLTRLEPGTTYVVGGLVDKNREKGLCYRRARARGIRTARLPIGEYMVMRSRQVLATNHVVSIMLKWLEYEDWGKAFLSVIPKRKGGRLREAGADEEEGEEGAEQEDDDDEQAAEDDGELAENDVKEAGENNGEQAETTPKHTCTA